MIMRHGDILHIVDGSSRARAEQARIGFALGSHCEVYGDIEEMMIRPPDRGVVIIKDVRELGGAGRVLEELAEHGKWLPVIATGTDPKPAEIVAAIQEGAVDYLPLPLSEERLADALTKVATEVAAHGEACQKVVEARRRISSLTNREREVLDWLAKGRSNKMIARELGISPRTVEIHRANMMTKIGAEHSAEAVRLRIEAQITSPADVSARDDNALPNARDGGQNRDQNGARHARSDQMRDAQPAAFKIKQSASAANAASRLKLKGQIANPAMAQVRRMSQSGDLHAT
jgi:FixJ family two-component response regulator